MRSIFGLFVLLIIKLTFAVDFSRKEGITVMPNKTGILTVEGSHPHGIVSLFMGHCSAPQNFNYTVVCNDGTEKYLIEPSSDDIFLFTFRSDDILVDCRDGTSEKFSQIVLNNSKQSGPNDEQRYSTLHDPIKGKKTDHSHHFVRKSQDISFSGEMIGRSFISFTLYQFEDHGNVTSPVEMIKLPVVIYRMLRPVDHAFQVVIYVFLIFVTLGFGCHLDLKVVKENLKRPIAPCIGMGCQFIVMPLLGFGIAKLVTSDRPDVALGIFVAGCCPGGGASNIYSYLLGGNVSLSITMTAISTILAFGMMPLWLYTLGRLFTGGDIEVPFLNIFTTLLVLIVPLFVGLFIQYKLPKIAKVLMKIIKPVTVVCIILLLTVGIYSNLYIFKLFEPKIILAGCLLPYFGYVLGGLIALIARLPWESVKTVAIETGMQNVGIAMILMMFAFPPPDGYIAAVAPIASAVMTPIPLFLITIPYLIYRRCNKEKYDSVSTESDKEKDGDGEKTSKGDRANVI